MKDRAGFTLLELLIVIMIIGILISISVPSYRESTLRAREAVFKEDLFTLRATIQRFTLDEKRPPNSLEELISSGYLAQLPKDITGTTDTWQVEYTDEPRAERGIKDVHSGSDAIARDGTPYNSW